MIALQVGEQLAYHRVVLEVEDDTGEREEQVRAVNTHVQHRLQVGHRLPRVHLERSQH